MNCEAIWCREIIWFFFKISSSVDKQILTRWQPLRVSWISMTLKIIPPIGLIHSKLRKRSLTSFPPPTHGLAADIQVKELDKRASGQAFEVILANADGAKSDPPLAQPQKKDVSLEEIQRKLDAAEERRKVSERLVWYYSTWLISLTKCYFIPLSEPRGRGSEALGWEARARKGGASESHGGKQ